MHAWQSVLLDGGARSTQQMKLFTHAGCFVQHAACWVCDNLFSPAYPAMLTLLGRERDVSKGWDQCRGVALEGLIRHGAQQARNGMKGSQRKPQGSPEVCGHQMTLRGLQVFIGLVSNFYSL